MKFVADDDNDSPLASKFLRIVKDSENVALPSAAPGRHARPPAKRKRTLLIALASLMSMVIFVFRSCSYINVKEPMSPKHRNPAFLIKAKNGAVASENIRCSRIGVDVLKEGGNAVDSAIASTFCIGVVNMFSSGIGGGGFMTVRIPPSQANESSKVYTIDFRETGPALANKTMFLGHPELSRFGGLSVGVPGELRGLEEAYSRWGTLPWKRLVQPSVDLAAGWEVDRELARRIMMHSRLMLNNSDWSSIFAPNGRLLKEGELIKRTNYSRTLSAIASEGAGALYKGPIADALLNKIRSTGGVMTLDDLSAFKVKIDRALKGTYRGKKVYTSHPPTSGPVLLHMLNLFENYNIAGEGRTGVNTHRIVEAMKFGFAARTKICDPEFNNNTKRMAHISTKKFARAVFANITDDQTHPPEYYKPEYDVKPDHGTSHSSILDKDGMAVSITSTVNFVFGSQVLDPVTGVILNNEVEMDDFSTPGTPNGFGLWPSPYNYPEPGKRPLSSTAPSIIENEDGSLYLLLGGSGGSRIFGSLFQVILNLEWGLDISQAVEYGRIHDQLLPTITDADSVYPAVLLEALRSRGHHVLVQDVNRIAGVVQAVMVKDGVIYATSDSRKNGIAAGY